MPDKIRAKAHGADYPAELASLPVAGTDIPKLVVLQAVVQGQSKVMRPNILKAADRRRNCRGGDGL